MDFDKNRLNRESLEIPVPRRETLTDELAQRIVDQSNDGAAAGNPLVASDAELDSAVPSPDEDGFSVEVSDVPLARGLPAVEFPDDLGGEIGILA